MTAALRRAGPGPGLLARRNSAATAAPPAPPAAAAPQLRPAGARRKAWMPCSCRWERRGYGIHAFQRRSGTRLSGRHIAHGIQGQKCRDSAVHVLRCGRNGHLPPTWLISGFSVSAEAALAIESCHVSPMSTPGRSRTDTGDPFRGPASSLGLRGRIHNTAVQLPNRGVAKTAFHYPDVHQRLPEPNCGA
jgi:hypothetical protein